MHDMAWIFLILLSSKMSSVTLIRDFSELISTIRLLSACNVRRFKLASGYKFLMLLWLIATKLNLVSFYKAYISVILFVDRSISSNFLSPSKQLISCIQLQCRLSTYKLQSLASGQSILILFYSRLRLINLINSPMVINLLFGFLLVQASQGLVSSFNRIRCSYLRYNSCFSRRNNM
ncbi:Hypothetical_protein [Hexamita inflata]|uniref:Hypothetical_protein n=1 Tax=Hexamita inflata TaxID=28002 RepID=A0AA86QUL1_9EUKA|nr:Hypothetical protein HINF_LOCUS47304 [Hexamita inflata]